MAAGVVGRLAEAQAADDFLTAASGRPRALVVEGEPGIGKTTLWSAVVQHASDRGFLVLSARPAAAESHAKERRNRLIHGSHVTTLQPEAK